MEENLIQYSWTRMIDRITKVGAVMGRLRGERATLPLDEVRRYKDYREREWVQERRLQQLISDYARLCPGEDQSVWIEFRDYRLEEGRPPKADDEQATWEEIEECPQGDPWTAHRAAKRDVPSEGLIQTHQELMLDRIMKVGAVEAKLRAERAATGRENRERINALEESERRQNMVMQELVMDYARLHKELDHEDWLHQRMYREEEAAEGPGKFEGEECWVQQAYAWSGDGSWNEAGSLAEYGIWAAWAQVTWDEIEHCPELDLDTWMLIEEDEQGFVRGTLQEEQPEDSMWEIVTTEQE